MGGDMDFLKAEEKDIIEFIRSIAFDPHPDSNLIVRKGILKRDGGTFKSFKESTVLLTRDK